MEGGCGGSSASKEMNVVIRDDESLDHLLKSCIQENITGSRDKIEAFKSTKPENFRIYRVSAALHELNEHAYSPRVVSIGPLHRGKKHLLAMEDRKLSYMDCLFERTQKKVETLKSCASAMREMESVARNCYAEEIELNEINVKPVIGLESKSVPSGDDCYCNTEKLKFAEMMLIDGCFIIELLYRHHKEEDRNDPILRNTLLKSTIQDDLLLLENQIPFVVLKKLYDLTVKCIPVDGNPCFLEKSVISFFGNRLRITNTTPETTDSYLATASHLLDFSHKIHLMDSDCRGSRPTNNTFNLSATKIHSAGVEFKEKSGDLFQVDFKEIGAVCESWFNGLFIRCCEGSFRLWPILGFLICLLTCMLYLLCLPSTTLLGCLCGLAEIHITHFSIYDYTELLLRNLIAYEQSCPDIKSFFTSHAKFMDTLIDSTKDIELLEKAGVIQNHLGCGDEAAKLFNNLCKHIVVDNNNFYIFGLSGVEKYYSKYCWPRNLAKLRRDYFGSPWSGIAVIAAAFIFTLTLLQTIFTILSYYE